MKTFSAKPIDIKKKWYIIDASNLILGRLASFVAYRLRGKHLPIYTPHMDCGDNLIIININKIKLSGNKKKNKLYYWHTGYPGGIKFKSAESILESKYPERILISAVKNMIPRGPLGRSLMKNLKVYSNDKHLHEAQKPEILNIPLLI